MSLRFQDEAALLRKLAEQAGFTYAERYGPRIAIQDPRYNNARTVGVETDSVGVMLVAPGFPAVVRYGPVEPAVLRGAGW